MIGIGPVLGHLRREKLLLVLLLALPVLVVLSPEERSRLHLLVDWSTIGALAGLMILSRALEESGYLFRAGRTLLFGLKSERALAWFLVVFVGALSTVTTNDVALFNTVPLTLRLLAGAGVARTTLYRPVRRAEGQQGR